MILLIFLKENKKKEVSELPSINEEQIANMFTYMLDMWCGINELEIIIPILKKRINRMLKKTNECIEMYENDTVLRNFRKAIEIQYKTKERIEKLLK